MKKLMLAVMLLAVVGCKKIEGEKGDKGDPGPGTITNYTGVIWSDTQLVYVPAYTGGAGLSVFIEDATGAAFELPAFLPGSGFNTYYLAKPGSLTLYNTMVAGGKNYRIMVIKGSGAAGLSALKP